MVVLEHSRHGGSFNQRAAWRQVDARHDDEFAVVVADAEFINHCRTKPHLEIHKPTFTNSSSPFPPRKTPLHHPALTLLGDSNEKGEWKQHESDLMQRTGPPYCC